MTAPHIPAACSTLFTSNTRLTVSWLTARAAALYDIQLHDEARNQSIYSVTVHTGTSVDIPRTKVDPHSTYMFYVTASGNDSQVGNTVSCTAVTGMYKLQRISN